MKLHSFVDGDGIEVFYRQWPARGEKRGGVVVAHGASEHSERYDRCARILGDAGYDVRAIDHRGHGRTAASTGPGLSGPRGMDAVLDNLGHLVEAARVENPGLPVVLFGHSMGSLLAQAFVERGDAGPAGYILSGCPGPLAMEEEILEGIRGAVAAGMGDQPADLFGPFNEPFEPTRTSYDWLSRDAAEVDLYIADPLCGDDMPLTYGFIDEMLALATSGMSEEGIARTPRSLPVLLITGEMDPASGMATQVRVLEERLRSAGLDVSAQYYAGARHELLNETNRDEVHAHLLDWLKRLEARAVPRT